MITINCQCDACNGTGLYQGFMEANDEAVICVRCGGKGSQIVKLKEFTGRRRKNNIMRIRMGSGTIIEDTRNAKWISYREFKEMIPADGVE